MAHAICAPACALFDLPDVHVLAVERGPRSFTLAVETVPALKTCPSCAVLATDHGRRNDLLHDRPCAGVPVREVWRKRIHRCLEDACQISTFSEFNVLAAPRAKLTTRAIAWAVTQLRSHDLGHRGRAGEPFYGIRRTLQIGAEHLTVKQITRLDAKLAAGDPN